MADLGSLNSLGPDILFLFRLASLYTLIANPSVKKWV